MDKLRQLLGSRKFWALIAAVVAAAAAFSTGEISQLEALRLIVESIMVYIGAVAVEDGLRARSTGR